MKERYFLFEKICRIMADSKSPRQALMTVVKLVADRMKLDVCSVYLIDNDSGNLVLRASAGLEEDVIDTIVMKPDEGLTGMVFEKAEPVFVINPSEHPRYKYFKASGEERFHTYLGVPLLYHRQNLGALVFQTIAPDAIGEKDIPFFIAIAGQIASLAAYRGLLEDLETEKSRKTAPPQAATAEKPSPPSARGTKSILRGIPVSPGIAEGTVHYLARSIGFDQIRPEYADDSKVEISRFETALKKNTQEIRELTGKLEDLSLQDAAIFESHLMMLTDPSFKKQVIGEISDGYTAEYALKKTIEMHIQRFLTIDDPYLRERSKDIEDLGRQVLKRLLGESFQKATDFKEDTILIAADLSPQELLHFKQKNLKGLALSRGGRTSHTAILAKSFEIPLVVGLSEILDQVHEGDHLILDGNSGLVFRNPSEDILLEYKGLISEKKRLLRQLKGLREKQSATRDGHVLPLDANIGLLSDVELAKLYGAENIGLYRTEFPFIIRDTFPSEEEQVGIYEKIIESAEGKDVTIRTLDLGGDKFLSYFDAGKEDNPYLGWRSIRVSLDREDLFRTQIRAVLRVSATKRVKLLFPMLCCIKEARRIAEILGEEKDSLAANGVEFDPSIPIGAMIEVPSAARILKNLLEIFDFISIGTNDLIQYLLAVDRNNPKVASLYSPFHPSVLLTIQDIATACRDAGKPVSICGEAAGNPKCAYLFLAMGIHSLSMTPSSIPVIKKMIRKTTKRQAEEDLLRVMEMDDEDEIVAFLEERLKTSA
jgi:phosphotransferase system enzyme I (PtsP)